MNGDTYAFVGESWRKHTAGKT